MADTQTLNYQWTKPQVGASTDSWGTKINADLDAIDAQVKVNANALATYLSTGSGGATLTLNKGASGQADRILGQTAGLDRWIVSLGDQSAETGSSAGSDFSIFACDDTGAALASASLSIKRSTGVVSVNQTPAAPSDVATKAYVDAKAGATVAVPIGGVVMFAGSVLPSGFFWCDGTVRNNTAAPLLQGVIGYAYGGNGTSTFAVPDLRGAFPLGVSSTHALASKGGEETHTLVSAEMPSHTHADAGHTHAATQAAHSHQLLNYMPIDTPGSDVAAGSGYVFNHTPMTDSQQPAITVASGTANLANAGGGGGHNNMPPFVGLNFIIRYQ